LRASSICRNRAGIGAMVAFVLWVVTIALVYALMVGQSQSGALTGVVRVTGMRMVVLAGQSALAEASYVLRHPSNGKSTVLEGMRTGSAAGKAHDPTATRKLYTAEVSAGRLTVEPVMYEVAKRPAKDGDPYLIDLTVRVTAVFAGVKITRQLRRRMLGELAQVHALLGPSAGKVVLAALSVHGRPLFEVVEP
jgi:hypothetical protein